MAFKDGDFLEIDYSAYDASSKELIATTMEKVARDSNTYNKDAQYGPTLVVLGSNGIIKGLDRELRSMTINESRKFTFKPEDAFGERQEDLVRVMPLSEFKQREINPVPGMPVDIDNVRAIVKSVNSGRVVVDANHPYAGREIIYDVKIVKNPTTTNDKIDALGRTYGVRPSSVSEKGKGVELIYDPKVKKNADYFIGKANLIASVFSFMKSIDDVEVKEMYEREKIENQQKKTDKQEERK